MKPWVIAALCATAVVRPAHADETVAVVDQVTLEPSILGGQRLQVTLSLAALLTGQHVELAEGATVRLVINNSKQDTPGAIGTYGATKSDTAIVFVIQTSLDFTDALPVITEAIDSNVLAVMNDRTQIAVLSFGDAQGAGKLQPLKVARGKINAVASDGSVGDPLLLDTVDRALTLLRKAQTDPEGRAIRKMIVVIGDGRDQAHDRERVTRVGTRAAKENVRIHSFAFSPKDVRKPLLSLGELSKRSRGTFRWVRGAKSDSWTPVMQQLTDEIKKQYVLSYWFPVAEEVSGKVRIEITGRTEVVSNELKIPDAACNGIACEPGYYCASDRCVLPAPPETRGVLGWILLIGGIAIAAIVVLGLIGFVMTKRQEAAAIRAKLPPGMVPPVATKSKQPTNFPFQVPSTAPPSIAPASGARFVVMSGPMQGREFPITHGMQIGKAPTCQLLIDDGYTSTYHAQATLDHLGNVHLYDSGSTNGTFVNGERGTVFTLQHGCTVKIGSTDLKFLAQ